MKKLLIALAFLGLFGSAVQAQVAINQANVAGKTVQQQSSNNLLGGIIGAAGSLLGGLFL